MPKFNVERRLIINAPIEKVHEVLSDFSQWRIWSPWLITEPEASMNIADDGQSYTWLGQRVGEGSMLLVDSTSNHLNYQLTFLKPWKSKADITFSLVQHAEGVEVCWSMASQLPWFMFWMKKMMIALIDMDYERGLLMLKDYLEKGEVICDLAINGEQNFAGCQFVGIRTQSTKTQVDTAMVADFEKLATLLTQYPNIDVSKAISIYHDFDLVSGNVEYTSGFIVNELPESVPAPFILSQLPAMKMYSLTQTGPYRHLGNAWSMMMGLQQTKAFKANKTHHPFELYHNDPSETPENELLTEIHFACK